MTKVVDEILADTKAGGHLEKVLDDHITAEVDDVQKVVDDILDDTQTGGHLTKVVDEILADTKAGGHLEKYWMITSPLKLMMSRRLLMTFLMTPKPVVI